MDKFKLLMSENPQETVFTTQWLRNHGVDNKLTWWYIHSGWLERIGSKAYKRLGNELPWSAAIAAMQQQLNKPLYVGGKTALQLLGKSHYLPLGGVNSIELFTLPAVPVPNWLTKTKSFEVKFLIYKTALFDAKTQKKFGLTNQDINNIPLLMSAPERAMVEVFSNVPNKTSYEESLQLMENLPYLRSEVVQQLLENCQSIKAKRLFLHTAEICQHEWLKDLNLKKIKLGTGKRKIGSGGMYDPKYQLSVPILNSEEKNEW